MNALAQRPDPTDYHAYYEMYITRVPSGDLRTLLDAQRARVMAVAAQFEGDRQDHAYAPGKWTVRQLMQHVADTERVMGYRVLRFARRDPTELPGFDQDLFADNGASDARTLAQICEEFAHLRRANVALLEGLDAEALAWRGRMWDKDITLLALCLLLHGHVGHHLDVLDERYA